MKKLLAMLIISGVSFSLVACGGSKGPEAEVKEFFKELKSGTLVEETLALNPELQAQADELKKEYASEIKEIEKLVKNITKKIDGDIANTTVDGESATVTVNIKAIDYMPIILEITKDIFTEGLGLGLEAVFNNQGEDQAQMEKKANDLAFNILKENLSEAEVKTVDKTYEVKLKKNGEEWEILNEEELMFECMNLNFDFLDALESQSDGAM
ncbi:MAG: hypothetical protein ACRC41_04455 [Sarcina sp.]